ncbi:hypothetical protein G9A89_000175 [Geosiphon pyriformis]|nr:hypothetical protein G9A89_000175 [Geosiphon pyriformis]
MTSYRTSNRPIFSSRTSRVLSLSTNYLSQFDNVSTGHQPSSSSTKVSTSQVKRKFIGGSSMKGGHQYGDQILSDMNPSPSKSAFIPPENSSFILHTLQSTQKPSNFLHIQDESLGTGIVFHPIENKLVENQESLNSFEKGIASSAALGYFYFNGIEPEFDVCQVYSSIFKDRENAYEENVPIWYHEAYDSTWGVWKKLGIQTEGIFKFDSQIKL